MGWKSFGTYKLAIAATSAAALAIDAIAEAKTAGILEPELRINASCGVVLICGKSTVAAADASEDGTTKRLPAGMVRFASGAIETYTPPGNTTHMRWISDDESSTGTLWLDVGVEVGA